MFSTITPPIESYKEEQKCFEFLIMLRTNVQVLLIRNEGRRKYSNIKKKLFYHNNDEMETWESLVDMVGCFYEGKTI